MFGEELHVFLLGSITWVSGGESASLSFLFFICFRLSMQAVEFKQSISPCRDAEGYLLVAAASTESKGGAGRQLRRGGREVTADAGLRFISVWCCRRKKGWHVREGEHITRHATSGIVNWVCSRIFPVVNVAQMETGLNEIFVGCSAGSVKDRLRLLLLISHGKFNL